VSSSGLAPQDPRLGQRAIDSGPRHYLLFLACELSVLALTLISMRYFKLVFCMWWTINDRDMARILLAPAIQAQENYRFVQSAMTE
jgi:hypothetical protein